MASEQIQFENLAEGMKLERKIEIDQCRVITFMGDGLRVYETPSMIADMEYACRDLLHQRLPPGWDSVGVAVDIEHLAATPMGATVSVAVEIIEIIDRRIRFGCAVHDSLELAGRGIHERFIINVDNHRRRLAVKRAKLQR